MPMITIEPATPERFGDAQHALDGGGDGRSCQCQWWTITNAEWNASTQEQRARLLRDEVDSGPPPALIAYVDGEAAGWVRVGPRTKQVRLGRTKNYTATSLEPWDDPAVWAVTCFVVRREHRAQGLNATLLDAAIAYARDGGARVIEAYPIDTSEGKTATNDLFHGALSTFEAAGFEEVGRPKAGRPIVSLTLS